MGYRFILYIYKKKSHRCRFSITIQTSTTSNLSNFTPSCRCRVQRQCTQAEANSSSKGSVGHACETGKPAGFKRKGSSIRPRRAAETASSKLLKAKQNHGKRWQDSSPKRKPIPPQRVVWGMHAKQGNPSRIQAQGVVNSSPDGLPKQHLRNG